MSRITVKQIKSESLASGSCFFDPDAMRFWGTRLVKDVFETPDGTLFVTSEDDHTNRYGRRAFTVRRWYSDERSITTVGDLWAYPTQDAALQAAEDLARRINDGEAMSDCH